ncbi:DUF4192 family protein [Corynebacterium atypicum]|nr:DUF4192 family protein [Corynebacterium atypicum]
MTQDTITTPGQLIANVPGLLGFYPTDSLILMAFATGPTTLTLGPMLRADLEAMTSVAAAHCALGSLDADGRVIIGVIVQDGRPELVDAATDALFEATRAYQYPVLGVWWVPEIAAGA